MTTYLYRGDKLTDEALRGVVVTAVRRADGLTIRGRNGNMLVQTTAEFDALQFYDEYD